MVEERCAEHHLVERRAAGTCGLEHDAPRPVRQVAEEHRQWRRARTAADEQLADVCEPDDAGGRSREDAHRDERPQDAIDASGSAPTSRATSETGRGPPASASATPSFATT